MYKHIWSWKKYFYNTDTYISIPKKCNYVNMELLTAVFRGKMIYTVPDNCEFTKESLREKYI